MNSKVWGTVYLPFLLLSFTGIMASLYMHLHFGIRGTAFLLLKPWYHFRLCHKEDELLNMPASLFPLQGRYNFSVSGTHYYVHIINLITSRAAPAVQS